MNAPDTTSWSAQAGALAARATVPVWLADLRDRARAALATAAFPGRDTATPPALRERWKYTSLQRLADAGSLARSAPPGDAVPAPAALPALDAWRIVFSNGHFDRARSQLPDDSSLRVAPLSEWPEQDRAALRAALPENDQMAGAPQPFALLNAAAFADGLGVLVGKGQVAGKPLHLVFHADGAQAATVQARLAVVLAEHAALTLVEQYTGDADNLLTNAVTGIEVGRGARLLHCRLQLEGARTLHIGSLRVRQQADSRVDSFHFMGGSRLRRNELHFLMDGAGAELTLDGAWLARGDSHVDNQVCVEHRQPHGSSRQAWKGLVGDSARAVFNGRIHIHPGAKQTSADLVNNNLLLSRDAEVDTKPELEIYNDDVKCSHGATVGQLNAQAVFYLQSRGIERQAAELMLSLGFINAQVDALPLAAVADWLRAGFTGAFSGHGSAGGGA